MGDSDAVLRRTGIVLMAAGGIDVGVMIFCNWMGIGYASSLNLFAVVTGWVLYRESLGAARFVAWYCAFVATSMVGFLAVLILLSGPVELWMTQLRLYPWALIGGTVFGAVLLALHCWVYRSLRSAPVLAARRGMGLGTSAPKVAFLLPAALFLAMFGAAPFVLDNATRAEAAELAREQYGVGYKYHLTGKKWSDGHVWAKLTAFNDDEIRYLEVELPPP